MSKNNTSSGATRNPYPVLENLFNSKIRVKVLKYLFRNHPINVGVHDLARRIQEPVELVKKEMQDLQRIGLIKSNKQLL